MLPLRLYFIIFLTILIMSFKASAITHWVVTENGKIQPRLDAILDMCQTDDLLTFLNQEKRKDAVNAIYKNILMKKVVNEDQLADLHSAVNIARRLYSLDTNCLQADKLLDDIFLYAGILIDDVFVQGNEQKSYILKEILTYEKENILDCKDASSKFCYVK